MQETAKNSKEDKNKNVAKKQTGITLIALIITIIVLFILAGVSVITLTGDKGIIIQANQAKENTNSTTAKEKVEVETLKSIDKNGKLNENTFEKNVTENIKGSTVTKSETSIIVKVDGYDVIVDRESGEITGVTKSDGKTETPPTNIKPGIVVSETEKNNYSDGTDMATVPQGFTVSGKKDEQIIANGLVIYDIPKSEISNVDWNTASTKYNQFVWIPVENEKTYQRNFNYPSYYGEKREITPANSTFSDTGYLPTFIQPAVDTATNSETAERIAVLKYNGFYISRYEIGVDIQNLKPVSKQNATIYANKSQTEFKTIGKNMYGDNSTYAKSAMCSGIQWDMAMKFVNGKKDGKGITYDVKARNANRHAREMTTAGKNIADKVQNIYDLEGNFLEYVAEKNGYTYPFVFRGGEYRKRSDDSASERDSADGSAYSDRTFRAVLYIK